jgi:signal transduction histidine kinase
MLARTKLEQEQREHVNVIHFSADLLNHLIENLLDFSRLEKQQLTLNEIDFNLSSMLKYLTTFFNEFARQKNVSRSFVR